MLSSPLLRWRAALADFSTWLDSRWRSRFRLLLRFAPQNGIGTPWQRHLTPPCLSPCPCPTDPPPPAAAPHRTAAPPQGAPPPSRKTVMAPRWGEDMRPKLLRRRGTAGVRSDLPLTNWRRGRGLTWPRESDSYLPDSTPPPPPPWDTCAQMYGKTLDWNKRQLDCIRQTNQPLSCSAVAVAVQNPNKVGWKGDAWNDREREEQRKRKRRKRRQLVTDSLPKKKKKERALPQMRHSCKSDSQTLAETLPSFLGWRKLRSLTRFLLSLSLRLLSPQALQNPGIKETPLPFFLSLPPSLPSPRPFPEAKQQRGAVFVEAGVEAYAEQHQIWPAPSYHCNYAFHCPDTKDDRMCGIGTMFHNVSASFCVTGLRERLVQQGNARLVPHVMDCLWAVIHWHTNAQTCWRNEEASLRWGLHHCTLVLTTVGGRKNMQNCTESCLRWKYPEGYIRGTFTFC